MAGLQWYNSLRAKYAAVLPSVPGLLKLARRLLVDGEETLRECFLAGVQTGTAPIFAECMPESELAMTESALEEAFKALQGGQAEATAMAARRPKKENNDAVAAAPKSGLQRRLSFVLRRYAAAISNTYTIRFAGIV